ncbi:MAG: DUF58 domain-containing protein [Ilumatobacteraceae bacterium]
MLTRSGWGAIALAAVSFVIGRIFGIIELYILGVGIAAALVVAVCTMLLAPPRLVVRRLVQPSTVQAGEASRVDLQVANRGNRRSPVLQLWEPVGPSDHRRGGRGGAAMQLAPLRPGERTSAAYRLPTDTRGLIRVGPMHARRRDVLGLASRTVELSGGSVELLVMPRHLPLRFALGGSAGRLGDHLRIRAQGQSGTEFHSLRQYVQGDDLRRISWKASARSQELVVKETALEGLRRCTVLLDTDPWPAPFDDEDMFERAVSIAAGLVTGASASGLATRLVAPDTDLRGPDVAPVALRWLATVEQGQHDDGLLPPLNASEGIGVLVVVTTSAESPCCASVRAAMAPEDTLVVIAVGDPTPSRSARFVVDATDDDTLMTSWASLTGEIGTGPRLPSAYGATG